MDKIEKAKKILEEQHQMHIEVKNEEIAEQILNIDFEQLKNLYNTVDEEIIYEDIKHPYFPSLPTYAYVTYNDDLKKIGLISTFYIFMTPKIKSIIREYEKIYQPSYVEIIKKNGLIMKCFIDSQ